MSKKKDKLKPIINNNAIKMSNKLACAKYAMNVSEQKLFLYAVRNIDQTAKKFPESKFEIKDFADYADLDVIRLYKDIDKMTTSLMQIIIYIEDEYKNNKWIKHNLTKTCKYNNGVITFKFNDDMKPLLLGLQKCYFKQAPEIMGFSSWYSFRLYDLLKSQAFKKEEILIELDWLRTILDIENKYSSFKDLRVRVIEPAIEEINEHSDIKVSYNTKTEGRKVVALTFKILLKDDAIDYTAMLAGSYDTDIFKNRIGLTPKVLTDVQIIELYDISVQVFSSNRNMDDLYEYMRLNYEYTKKRKPYGNPYSYYKKAIENDYAKAIPQILSNYIINP